MKNTHKLIAAAAGLSLALLVQPASAEIKDPSETLKANFIIHAACGNVFYEPIIFGANLAGEIFNVDVTMQCAEGDLEAHVDLIETGIASGVDGIIDQISTPDTMTDAIQKARDAGITVIAASLDDKGTARQAFFGQNFVESGYMVGKRIVEVHGLGEGDFCVTPVEFPELTYAHDRYAGVKMALDEAGVESESIGVGAVVEENQNLIAEYLVGNPDTDCIIGLGNVPTSVAPQAAEDAGMDGLPNGGFDVNPRIMENINAGLTTATVDQQPFLQGFLPVMFVALNQRYGIQPSDLNTGVGIVDSSNADVATAYAGTYR
ncbi:MAG: substrate-binding domain-containing protein [Rhodospirillaceae bacterium]|nr:substrate-binding domain-containing protein [Rhodospirillaceae bacterium]